MPDPYRFQTLELLYQPAATLRVRPHTRNNYRHIRNVVYAEAHGVGLIMDVFQPISGARNLGVADIISGGWHSDRTLLNEHIGFGLIDALCERGITVFAVSPGSLPLFTGLEMMHHVHVAIRHIKAHADVYAVDPNRLGIMGVSAGGHLAALATLNPVVPRPHTRPEPWQQQDTSVKAAALFFPPSDLLDYSGASILRFQLEGLNLTRLLYRDGIVGRSDKEIEQRLEALSPARMTPHAPPPHMIVQGKQDYVVPWQQAEKLAATLRHAGGEVQVLYKEDGGHVWPGINKEVDTAAQWLLETL